MTSREFAIPKGVAAMPWQSLTISSWREFDILATDMVHANPFQYGPVFLYRGHSCREWKIESTLQRALPGASRANAVKYEEYARREFYGVAHLHLSGLSEAERSARLRAWPLMRHHGVPTRLIDWSESPYVALYFAVASSPECDAEVIAIKPDAIHRALPKDVPLGSKHQVLEHTIDYDNEDFLFVFPPVRKSERMVSQQGHFTISNNPVADHETLILDAAAAVGDTDLYRIVIPKTLKKTFLRQLRLLNVTPSAIYPGLDGVGQSLADAARLYGYIGSQAEIQGVSELFKFP